MLRTILLYWGKYFMPGGVCGGLGSVRCHVGAVFSFARVA